MSEAENAGIVSLTVPVMATFVNLITAKAFKRNGKEAGEPKFGASFEFPADHPDLPRMKAAAVAAAKAKWPNRALSELKFPFQKGDTLADEAKAKAAEKKAAGKVGYDREWSRGKIVITSRSKYAPRLAIAEGGKVVDLTEESKAAHSNKFYSGVQALAQFNFVAYEGGNGPDGVTAYLNMVVSLNKGARIGGGGQAASEVFKGYVGIDSADDPFAGSATMDDEIPF